MYNFYSSILVINKIFVRLWAGGGGEGRKRINISEFIGNYIYSVQADIHITVMCKNLKRKNCLGLKDKLGYERRECVTRFVLKYIFFQFDTYRLIKIRKSVTDGEKNVVPFLCFTIFINLHRRASILPVCY